MQVLQSCARVTAEVRPVYAEGSARPVRHDLYVEVGVSDRDVVRQMKGFDGLEVVSVGHAGHGAWQESPLQFVRAQYASGNTMDMHQAVIHDVNVDAVLRQGVSVALSTNVGAAALQAFGANHAVSYRSRY